METSLLIKNPVNLNNRRDDIFDTQIDGYLCDQKNPHALSMNIYVCSTCQLLFKQSFFSAEELENIYRHQYFLEETKISTSEGFVYNNHFFLDMCSQYSLDLVKKIITDRKYPVNTIFDIGGRNGFRLEGLARNNFNCTVFDPIPLKPNNPAIKKEYLFLNEIDETKHSSDLILLCNILEHCKDPTKVIQKCHGLLKHEGFLFIQVPFDNPQILEWLILGKIRGDNLRIDMTHFLFFSKKSLEYLLTQNGFRCLTLNLEFLPIIKGGKKILVINLLAQKSADTFPPPKSIIPDFSMINMKVLKCLIGDLKTFVIKK
jgi:SAM-dependent methyltransferase